MFSKHLSKRQGSRELRVTKQSRGVVIAEELLSTNWWPSSIFAELVIPRLFWVVLIKSTLKFMRSQNKGRSHEIFCGVCE